MSPCLAWPREAERRNCFSVTCSATGPLALPLLDNRSGSQVHGKGSCQDAGCRLGGWNWQGLWEAWDAAAPGAANLLLQCNSDLNKEINTYLERWGTKGVFSVQLKQGLTATKVWASCTLSSPARCTAGHQPEPLPP